MKTLTVSPALTLLLALACSSEPGKNTSFGQAVPNSSVSLGGASMNGAGGLSAIPNANTGGVTAPKTGGASGVVARGGSANTASGGASSGSGGSISSSGGTSATGGGSSTGGATAATGGTNGQPVSGDPGAALNGQRWDTPHQPMQAPGKDYCVYKDMDAQFGGTPGTTYNVTLRFRGVLEGKEYVGGTAQGQGLQFYTGGMPGTTDPWPNYNTVGFTVSAPMQTYYLNNAESNVIFDDTVYGMDYTVTIQIAGGATLHLFSQDPNCNAIPNVAGSVSPGVTAPIMIPTVASNGMDQFAQMDVVLVTQ